MKGKSKLTPEQVAAAKADYAAWLSNPKTGKSPGAIAKALKVDKFTVIRVLTGQTAA